MDWSAASRSLIRANLAAFERRASGTESRRAAVAIALLLGDGGEVAFPLFLRDRGLARDAGQMALPGGRLDDRIGPGGMEGAIKSAYRVSREVLAEA